MGIVGAYPAAAMFGVVGVPGTVNGAAVDLTDAPTDDIGNIDDWEADDVIVVETARFC